MNNNVNFNKPVATLVKGRPELLNLLVDIGFTPLKNKVTLETLGKVVTLNKGTKIAGVDKQTLVNQLTWNGYIVEEVEYDE